MGPELNVREHCGDGELALLVTSVTLEPLGARRVPAAHDEGHAICDVLGQSVKVIPEVSFKHNLLIILGHGSRVPNEMAFPFLIVKAQRIVIITLHHSLLSLIHYNKTGVFTHSQ